MDTPSRQNEKLLTPAEVAALFRVDPKTVTRWARSGKLSAIRTLGGHRRFLESEVRALMGVPVPRKGPEAAGSVPLPGAAPHDEAASGTAPGSAGGAKPRSSSRTSSTRSGSQGSGPRRAAGS